MAAGKRGFQQFDGKGELVRSGWKPMQGEWGGMRSTFKHPQIYSDVIRFHKLYRQAHKHLPKDLRVTTGEQILAEITTCLGCVAAANFVNKSDTEARRRAARELVHMRERLEVIRAFLILAWEERAISHHQLANLSARLDELGKQASGWQQWFERGEPS